MRRASVLGGIASVAILAGALAGRALPAAAEPPAAAPTPYPPEIFERIVPPIDWAPPTLPPTPAPTASSTPRPTPKPTPKPQPKATPAPRPGGPTVRGTATWYCRAGASRCTATHPDGPASDLFAAAGPALRSALGPGWRGRIVIVTARTGAEVRVRLVDWCACGGDHVIDLYWDAFAWLQIRGKVNPVTVRPAPLA